MTKEDRFKLGVEQFNTGYFFECHDTFEDMWMDEVGEDRMFLQGLIQVSVGFYHLFNRNFKGAVSQFTKALKKLERYRPAHHPAFLREVNRATKGIELELFTNEVQKWRERAERGLGGEDPALDESLVPRIHFVPFER